MGLLIFSLLCLSLSVFSELIFNSIAMPGIDYLIKKDKNNNDILDKEFITELYHGNKPPLLRDHPLFDLLIRKGGMFFYVLFAFAFTARYLATNQEYIKGFVYLTIICVFYFIKSKTTKKLSLVFMDYRSFNIIAY